MATAYLEVIIPEKAGSNQLFTRTTWVSEKAYRKSVLHLGEGG
jgi:hypothetical protein